MRLLALLAMASLTGCGCQRRAVAAECAQHSTPAQCNASGKCLPRWADMATPSKALIAQGYRCEADCRSPETPADCAFRFEPPTCTGVKPERCAVRTVGTSEVCIDVVGRCTGCAPVFLRCEAMNPCNGVICL